MKLLLLIEDDPMDQMIFKDCYEESGILPRLHIISDGEQALDFIMGTGQHKGRIRPDFVFLDINLPKISGLEILRRIKNCDDRSVHSTPVAILSGSDAKCDIDEAYDLNANCFIHKGRAFKKGGDFLKSFDTFWFECGLTS